MSEDRNRFSFRNVVFCSECQTSVPQPFSPAVRPNLSKTHDGTPQNFASQKGSTKLCMAINMYLHIKPCPKRMQAYENKTTHV
jgi:hypothetical protein